MFSSPKDSYIPVSTTDASNVEVDENLEEKEDTQSHRKSSLSKQMSFPEPIVKITLLRWIQILTIF